MSDFLDRAERRIDRGGDIICAWWERWGNIPWWLFVMFVGLVMSPYILLLYVIGHVSEWRENRRDGIEDVRE